MTRMIDADALSEKLCETTIFIKGGEMFQRMINDAPTIEPSGDLISRQDAIDAVKNRIEKSEVGESVDHDQVIADIESLPSADRPIGE